VLGRSEVVSRFRADSASVAALTKLSDTTFNGELGCPIVGEWLKALTAERHDTLPPDMGGSGSAAPA